MSSGFGQRGCDTGRQDEISRRTVESSPPGLYQNFGAILLRYNANMRLQRLINLRVGQGAAILPPRVTRLHLDFALKLNGGHMGARKFWREHLPRLKYHNPGVPMIVNRHNMNEKSPSLRVFFLLKNHTPADVEIIDQLPSSNNNLSKPPQPGQYEFCTVISLKNKHSSEILDELLTATAASKLKPTADDLAEMQALEALKIKAVEDCKMLKAYREQMRKEREMLRRAKEVSGLATQ